jgi:S-DNA-T family DNA segregation ATPase FtsK/SpoIIIE
MTARQHADQPMFGSDDPLSIVLEAIVRTIWLVAVGVWVLVRFAFTQPVPVILTAIPVAAWFALGPRYAVGGLVWLIIMVVAWRLVGASSFNRLCAPCLAAAWRTPWYRLRWPRVARRHRLVAFDHHGGQDNELPKLRRVRVTRSGTERLLLRLPAGLTPDDLARACDGIAHAFRCLDARVVPKKPGWVWLELHRRDSLAATVPALSPAGVVDLGRVPVGRHEDGTTWSLRLSGTHLLIAGATGSGKGSVLWSLLNAMTPDIEVGRVAMWVMDPKGGMELRPGLPLFARFEDGTPDSMGALLEELVRLKDERARTLAAEGLRLHTPTADSPHIVLVIDELATLTALAERTVVRRIEQALGLLLTQGRACGITVVAAVQDPGKDVVGWRDLFPTRVALRLDNPIQVDMVLGEGARDAGARADQISELTPGVAYVRVEGTRELRRVRAAYLDDHDVAALAASITAEVGDRA